MHNQEMEVPDGTKKLGYAVRVEDPKRKANQWNPVNNFDTAEVHTFEIEYEDSGRHFRNCHESRIAWR